jgi:hypothetical protein
MSKLSIEIDILQAGQPRAYADSFYEAYISCRVDGMLMDKAVFYRDLGEDTVKSLARLFVHGFDDVPKDWAAPVLKICAPVGPTPEMKSISHEKWEPKHVSRWHVLIVLAYTD